MSRPPLRGRPTRAQSEAIDRRLRDAAVEAFVAHGFEATTMEAVAAAAGVTKRTLYAKYPDKQALFAAVIPRALAAMPFHDVPPDPPDIDLASALRALAGQIVARLIEPRAVALRRLALLEAPRLAQLDHVDVAEVWSASLRSVVRLLSRYAEAGEVVTDDHEVAADLFVAMVAGTPAMLADYGVFRTAEEVARHIDHAVDLFLTGILPRP